MDAMNLIFPIFQNGCDDKPNKNIPGNTLPPFQLSGNDKRKINRKITSISNKIINNCGGLDSLSLHIIFMYLSYTVVLPFMRVCINGPVYISVVMPECMGY